MKDLVQHLRSLAICAGLCLVACGKDAPTAPDRTPATLTVGVAAPATFTAGIRLTPLPVVIVRNAAGQPLVDVPVTITVDSGGGTVANAVVRTDTEGRAFIDWTLGRTVGRNLLRATVTGLPPVGFTVTTVAGPPSQMYTVGGRQTSYGNEALSVGIAVVDQFDNPVPGVPITFAPLDGSTVSTAHVNTSAFGVASTLWNVPATPGDVHLTGSAPSLAPLTFVATILPPPPPCAPSGALTLDAAPTAGTLGTSDCQTISGTYFDVYTLHLPTQTAFDVLMTSTVVDPLLSIYQGSTYESGELAAENDDISFDTFDAGVTVIAGAGDYVVAADEFEPQAGDYSLTTSSASSDIANCAEVFVVPNVTLDETLSSTDCDAGGGSFGDDIIVYLREGEQLDVTMTSTAFDAKLFLFGEIASNDFFVSDDNSGGGTNARLTFTAPVTDFFELRPTSALSGKTGAYTLSIVRRLTASVAASRVSSGATTSRRGTILRPHVTARKGVTLWQKLHASRRRETGTRAP
jgi:hypothetical protein